MEKVIPTKTERSTAVPYNTAHIIIGDKLFPSTYFYLELFFPTAETCQLQILY